MSGDFVCVKKLSERTDERIAPGSNKVQKLSIMSCFVLRKTTLPENKMLKEYEKMFPTFDFFNAGKKL